MQSTAEHVKQKHKDNLYLDCERAHVHVCTVVESCMHFDAALNGAWDRDNNWKFTINFWKTFQCGLAINDLTLGPVPCRTARTLPVWNEHARPRTTLLFLMVSFYSSSTIQDSWISAKSLVTRMAWAKLVKPSLNHMKSKILILFYIIIEISYAQVDSVQNSTPCLQSNTLPRSHIHPWAFDQHPTFIFNFSMAHAQIPAMVIEHSQWLYQLAGASSLFTFVTHPRSAHSRLS